jgi:hypothetical protein
VVGEKEGLDVVYGVSSTGAFDTYEVRYAHLSGDTIDFSGSETFSNPNGRTFDMGHFPSISYGADGNIYVTWELYTNPGARPRALAFTYSTDNGNTFESPFVIPGSNDSDFGVNGSQQGYLLDKLSVNKRGDIAVVNSTFMRGRYSYIWLFRGRHAFNN